MELQAKIAVGGTLKSCHAEDPLTFKHLLSNTTLNAHNLLRVVAHCDIDAAYAQFEMVRLGIAEDKPVAVQQWQGLIAVNYPARAFGISRHETVDEAKKKCPDLICCHVATYKEGEMEPSYYQDARPDTHKVSLDPYRREGLKILNLFGDFCPTIEKASIDEAFLDFTLPVRSILLERFPQLSVDPLSLPQGLDTPLPPPPERIDWSDLGHLIPLEDSAAEKTVPDAVTWSDVALSIGAELMQRCRQVVKERLGYTCSAGIARNRTLAKLCSSWKKPDAQTILRNEAIGNFLRPLPFQKIRFLGGKLGKSIALDFDAETIGDLWTVTLENFQQKLGNESGLWVWEIIRGLDYTEVEAKTASKSMLSSKNFQPALKTFDEALHWLKVLSTELHVRLNEARTLSPGLWPKTVILNQRSETYVSRARQLPFPYTSRLSPEYILRFAERLLNEHRDESKGGPVFVPCTNLALQFNGLERLEAGQKGIEGFFLVAAEAIIEEETHASQKRKTEDEDTIRYTCSRCRKTLTTTVTSTEEEAMKTLEQEHNDYHFARDLVDGQKVRVEARPRKLEHDKKTSSSKPRTTTGGQGTLSAWAKSKDKGGDKIR